MINFSQYEMWGVSYRCRLRSKKQWRRYNLAIRFTTNRRKTYFVTIALAIYEITSNTVKKIKISIWRVWKSYRSVRNYRSDNCRRLSMYIQILLLFALSSCRILFCLFDKKAHDCGDSKDKSAFVCLIKYKKTVHTMTV